MRKKVWDLEGMSEKELRALIRRCDAKEKQLKAPYAKARRTWVALRGRAKAELERRAGAP